MHIRWIDFPFPSLSSRPLPSLLSFFLPSLSIPPILSPPFLYPPLPSSFYPLEYGGQVDVIYVVLSNTVNTFKSRLDKFWQHQDVIYDLKPKFVEPEVGAVIRY